MAESEEPKPRRLTNRFHSIPVSPGRSWRIASDRCTFKRPTMCSREIPAGRAGKRQFSPITSSQPQSKGVVGKVGWHTLRHSYSTLLRSLGTDVKVQQELLR